jgi:hypothetical protein
MLIAIAARRKRVFTHLLAFPTAMRAPVRSPMTYATASGIPTLKSIAGTSGPG